jgi:hypothetical protein
MLRVHPSRLLPGLLIALAACGGDGPNDPEPKPPTVTAPTVETLAPTNVSTTALRLNGRVNANNGTATWSFEYGTTAALGSTCAGTGSVTGALVTEVFCDVSGLPLDATVFYRLVAQNSAGAGQSAVTSFALVSSAGINITGVSPSPMVEGTAATLTGTGFNPAATTVTVDGQAATVTAATATAVTFTVPASDCRPARNAQVVAGVGAGSSPARSHPVRPASFAAMAVGEQQILKGSPCLQFAAGGGSEAYLVGVQNISATGNNAMAASLSAEAGAAAAPSPMLAPAPRRSSVSLAPARLDRALRSVRRGAHERAEARLRSWERQHFGALAGTRQRSTGGARRAAIPATAAVGDAFDLKVPNLNASNLCQTTIPVRAVVRKVGARGIWLEDVANPAGGFTAADYQELSDVFDNHIYATDTRYFGDPTDQDGNSRILILVTKEVNKSEGVLGFVFNGDLFSPAQCSGTNQAEIYYAIAPDPSGTVGQVMSLEDARTDAPSLIAHEFAHILQYGVRLTSPTTTAFQTIWEAEGQATFAEEVVGHAVTGRQPGQNYGIDVAFPDSEFPWYQGAFVDLAVYYGFRSQTERGPGTPEECTWLASPSAANPQPCLGARNPYGVSWSFLRYLTDQFGPGFAGGEAGFHRRLVDDASLGFATMEAVTGQTRDVLLARWAASLYVDDLVANPQLRFTSWNMQNIFGSLIPTARLTPRELAFGTSNTAVSVRGGSSAYFRVSGAGRPATAVKARSAGGALPATGQMWVVRLQ